MIVGTKLLCLKNYSNDTHWGIASFSKNTVYTIVFATQASIGSRGTQGDVESYVETEQDKINLQRQYHMWYYTVNNNSLFMVFDEDGIFYLHSREGIEVFSDYFITVAEMREQRIDKILK
jgi:hypothetical protein